MYSSPNPSCVSFLTLPGLIWSSYFHSFLKMIWSVGSFWIYLQMNLNVSDKRRREKMSQNALIVLNLNVWPFYFEFQSVILSTLMLRTNNFHFIQVLFNNKLGHYSVSVWHKTPKSDCWLVTHQGSTGTVNGYICK